MGIQDVLEHPERPERVPRAGSTSGAWLVHLVVALAAGAVAALGVPWWLAVPVALLLELVCGIWMHRPPTSSGR